MCRSKDHGGRRCAGHRTPSTAPGLSASATVVSDATPAAAGRAHEPGTGPDWANAKGPEGMKPAGPATTAMRPWESIGGRQVPTDREYLAHLDATIAANAGTGEWANAINDAAQLRKRAAAGHHDGSLPELGDYRPVYFVPAPPATGSTR